MENLPFFAYLNHENGNPIDKSTLNALSPYFNQPYKCVKYARTSVFYGVIYTSFLSLILACLLSRNFGAYLATSYMGSLLMISIFVLNTFETILKANMAFYLSNLDENEDWKNLRKKVIKYFQRRAYTFAVGIEVIRSVSNLWGVAWSFKFVYYYNGIQNIDLHIFIFSVLYFVKKTLVLKNFRKVFFEGFGDLGSNIYGFREFVIG